MMCLKEITGLVVACSNLPIDNLPWNLQEMVTDIRYSLSKPSNISATIQFYNFYNRKWLDMVSFPQYFVKLGFPYPLYNNLTSKTHSWVPSRFSNLTVQFMGTRHRQINDIFQFASDVSGCEIGPVDVQYVEYETETEIVIHGTVYIVHHTFMGPLSVLLELLMSFRCMPVSHVSHFFQTLEKNNCSLRFEYLEQRNYIHTFDLNN